MELNKIFAAVLVAGIVAMLGGFVSKQFVHAEPLAAQAYPIEATEVSADASAAAAPSGPEPILALLATANVEQGQKLAKACAACHAFEKGAPNKVGPALWGVVGAEKGKHAGFSYSSAMASKGGKWTYADLNHFLWKPKDFVAGTKMTFAGLKKAEERAAVIAWLRTLADSPAPLPGAADIAAEAPPAAATPAPESSSPGPAGTPAPAAPATGKATPEPGAKAPPAAP